VTARFTRAQRVASSRPRVERCARPRGGRSHDRHPRPRITPASPL
jgi:hypothetical protein